MNIENKIIEKKSTNQVREVYDPRIHTTKYVPAISRRTTGHCRLLK